MNWFSAGELLELALSRVIPRSRTKGVLKAPFVLEESMTDDKTKTAAGRKRIDVHEDYELRYWTQNLASQKSSWKPPFGKLLKTSGQASPMRQYWSMTTTRQMAPARSLAPRVDKSVANSCRVKVTS